MPVFNRGRRYVERLEAELRNNSFPLRREMEYQQRIRLHRAFRESIHDVLRPHNWSLDSGRENRNYLIDPLGERIPYVWSDLLFGEDPVISPGNKSDAERMDDLINHNKLPSELQRAEWLCSSEGEVWYRISPDDVYGHAVIEWHSRLVTVPLFIGKHVMAVAFVSELDRDNTNIWRYVEIHGEGLVKRMLFMGQLKSESLGLELPLSEKPETADWPGEWEHGLPMLAGRIANKLGGDFHMGVSDYDGIEDLLLALNEITTIGQENARLTAKQRAIVPQRFLDMQGNLPGGMEILVATEVDQDPEKIKNEVAMIEFSFDATALIAYIEHLTDKILTRGRVAPQLVGRHTEGAQTGPALRARILDSELAASGKGKHWDDEMPSVVQKTAMVEQLSTEKGGLGIGWSSPIKLPSFKRASSLPEDPESLSRRLAIEVNAEMLSRKTAIQMSHPEWDTARVEDEVAQIMLEVGNNAEPPAPAPQAPGAIPVRASKPTRPEMGAGKAERSNGSVRARV